VTTATGDDFTFMTPSAFCLAITCVDAQSLEPGMAPIPFIHAYRGEPAVPAYVEPDLLEADVEVRYFATPEIVHTAIDPIPRLLRTERLTRVDSPNNEISTKPALGIVGAALIVVPSLPR
jgi:hypothetical protein